jgi:serine phosphatase RsbU (regulator of sigma subunit)
VGTSSEQETLVVPLIAPEGDLMGVLHVLGPSGHRFTEGESDLALMLGALAAIALKRQALVDQAAQKERLERELELAREIVRPPATPVVPGYELMGSFHPAQTVGGDCYDFKRLDEHRLAFLVADASGHGLDSALVVSRCRAYFRALVESEEVLVAIGQRLNALLAEDLVDDERFVAASLGRLDSSSRRLEVLSAGQTCCFWLPSEGSGEALGPSGPPLGLFPEIALESRDLPMSAGDLALFFTDGLSDWRAPGGETFGDERLGVALARWRGDPELCRRLVEEARAFAAGQPQPDDITCLVLRAY